MNKNHKNKILSAFLVLVFVTLACSGASTPQPTPTSLPPTDTPTSMPTDKPTSTPRPTATPDVAATQRYDDFFGLLQKFDEKGYVSTTDGNVEELEPFKEEWAQIGWYQWWPDNTKVVSDFVFKGHLNWSTASSTPDVSGCGIVFGLQDNGDHYAVFLDKSRILFLMSRGGNTYNVGKTSGPGRTNFGNPAEADFAVSVNKQSAFVSVNDDVTKYTLSMDQPTTGNFALTILSGTNKDYGTRCEITDMMFWSPK